jgi:hypothetical protein
VDVRIEIEALPVRRQNCEFVCSIVGATNPYKRDNRPTTHHAAVATMPSIRWHSGLDSLATTAYAMTSTAFGRLRLAGIHLSVAVGPLATTCISVWLSTTTSNCHLPARAYWSLHNELPFAFITLTVVVDDVVSVKQSECLISKQSVGSAWC